MDGWDWLLVGLVVASPLVYWIYRQAIAEKIESEEDVLWWRIK